MSDWMHWRTRLGPASSGTRKCEAGCSGREARSLAGAAGVVSRSRGFLGLGFRVAKGAEAQSEARGAV